MSIFPVKEKFLSCHRKNSETGRLRKKSKNLFKQKYALKKEMATRSSILVWIIPRTEEPGGLQSMGSQRVGHDWATVAHQSCSQRDSRHRQVAALSFLSKLVIWYIQMKGWNSHLEMQAWRSYSLIFIPASPSGGEEGFLSLFSLDWKCYGISV